MGRGGKRTMRRDFKKGNRDDRWSEKRAKVEYNTDLTNKFFEEYYKEQGIVPEGEWEAFLASLRKQLPTTFRINGSGQFANDLRDKLTSDFFSHFGDDLQVDGDKVDPPRPLPWYPNNYGWHFDFSRSQLRKHPLLDGIHEFMKRATDAGTITRQEAVSMLPPFFLDVEPQHKVLDMCAAPGSKTFQLLEALHARVGNPEGLVVANDADTQRCNLLTHQTKRMCSPCLVVTNHEAQFFPVLKEPDGTPMQFDRILCDVPCSGDGTMRKAPDIWRRWSVNNGNGLHLLQLKIFLQGASLLKVGGRMVYSTCTFNPIEDEAVVAEVLQRCGGSMKLVDVSDRMPELKRINGLKTWKVRDKFRWYSSWEEAENVAYKLDPTMFPTPEKQQLPLERCMRLLPHHQDTGGFFVAVLEKVGELPIIEWPNSRHRYMKGKQGDPETAMENVKAGAKACAEAATAALEKALVAADAGNTEEVGVAAKTAQAAAARAAIALQSAKEEINKEEQGPADQNGATTKGAAAEGKATAMEEDGAGDTAEGVGETDLPEEEAAAPAEEAAGEEAEADDGNGTTADKMEEDTEAPGPGGDEKDADADRVASGAEASTAVGMPAPSWIRGGGGRNRATGGRWRGIDPIIPVEDPVILHMVTKFYGLKPDFPLQSNLIVRAQEPQKRPKRLYYISPQVLRLLLADVGEVLKVTSTGLKIFERQEVKDGTGQCCYRIAQEGLPFLLPHITKQRVQLSLPNFLRLLTERSVPIPDVASPVFELGMEGASATKFIDAGEATTAKEDVGEANGDAVPAAAEVEAAVEAVVAPSENGSADAEAVTAATNLLSERVSGEQQQQPSKQGPCGGPLGFQNDEKLDDPRFAEQLKSIFLGCAVATLYDEDAKSLGLPTGDMAAGALTANAPPALCVWRAKRSMNVLVSKPECLQMIDKIKTAQQKLKAAEAAAEETTNGAT